MCLVILCENSRPVWAPRYYMRKRPHLAALPGETAEHHLTGVTIVVACTVRCRCDQREKQCFCEPLRLSNTAYSSVSQANREAVKTSPKPPFNEPYIHYKASAIDLAHASLHLQSRPSRHLCVYRRVSSLLNTEPSQWGRKSVEVKAWAYGRQKCTTILKLRYTKTEGEGSGHILTVLHLCSTVELNSPFSLHFTVHRYFFFKDSFYYGDKIPKIILRKKVLTLGHVFWGFSCSVGWVFFRLVARASYHNRNTCRK